MLACLPSNDLSSYSSAYQRTEPGAEAAITVEPSEPPAAAGDVPELPAPAATEPAPVMASECTGEDCPAPELPLVSDAGSSAPADDAPVDEAPEQTGGAVAPSDVTVSPSDAGAPPAAEPPAAEPPSAADAGVLGPCGQGALLAPDEDRCFALVTTTATWVDARAACQARGAGWDLAVIRSAERNALLTELLAGVTDVWVGASDLVQEGSWRWVDDNAPFFTGTGTAGSAAAGAFVNWNTGGTPEPNGGAASDCLRLRANGGWADIACTSTFASLCEGPQP